MFERKKKWKSICFLSFTFLFTIFLSTFVLSALGAGSLTECSYFYWYDANIYRTGDPGTSRCYISECKPLNKGDTTVNTPTSDSYPILNPDCCDAEGYVGVTYVTQNPYTGELRGDYGLIPAYNIWWDVDEIDCRCYNTPAHPVTWLTNVYYSSRMPSCCGDDPNEFPITFNNRKACCREGGANVCVSSSLECRYEYQDGGHNETSCGDGLDNDCDGLIDCKDLDCQVRIATEQTCHDRIDGDCDKKTDCSDPDCKNSLDCIGCEPETDKAACEDSEDNDCDGYIDCSDDDCANAGLCPDCVAEICDDDQDNDCDDKTDCADEDCYEYPKCGCSTGPDDCCSDLGDYNCDLDCTEETDTSCEGKCTTDPNNCCIPLKDNTCDSDCLPGQDPDCQTNCDTGSDDCCSGTIDNTCDLDCTEETDLDCVGKCTSDSGDCCNPFVNKICDSDCLPGQDPDCGQCVAENSWTGKCDDGIDNDCDGFKDHQDKDCPGCPRGKRLCANGRCKESCAPSEPQGCIGEKNGECEEGEGCTCKDCFGKRGSCAKEIICDPSYELCSCPAGTTMCADGKCRTKCFVCGDGIFEEGEECEGNKTACENFGCTGGEVLCTENCVWDTSNCDCPKCDPTAFDEYCCAILDDGICDRECTSNVDPDCTDKCTPNPDDCCKDTKDGICDHDCISYKDPDCSQACSSQEDKCCNTDSDGVCDVDCDNFPDEGIFVDPDCGEIPCTNNEDGCCTNDNDGVCDLDCIPGVDPDCKCGNRIIDKSETCDSGNLGNKTCADFFDPTYKGILACLDTSSEYPCHFDTSSCYKVPEVCGGEYCGTEKDCRCSECVDKQDSCSYGAVCDAVGRCACMDGRTSCKDGTCRSPQDCTGFGMGEQLCLTVEKGGTGDCDPGEGCGCKDCEGKRGPCNHLSVCRDGVCYGCFIKNAYWQDIEAGKEEECIGSGNEIKLTVEGFLGCEGKTINMKLFKKDGTEVALTPANTATFKNGKAELIWKSETNEDETSYRFEAVLEGKEKFESKELKVEYCVRGCDQDCDNYCEKTTDECKDAEYPDRDDYCNQEGGSIKLDANYRSPWCEKCDPYGLTKGQDTCAAHYDCTPGWWEKEGKTYSDYWSTDPSKLLEWRECDENFTRWRQICPNPDLCCITSDQKDCYCKVPSQAIVGDYNCRETAFIPSAVKTCLVEEKFPFFTNTNILIVVLILVGFYIWKAEIRKTKKKRNTKTKK